MADFSAEQVRRISPELLSQIARSLRPFLPGERVSNADGSYSTERSVTLPLPDGSWANVPSLWMADDGPVDFGDSEDAIFSTMRFYEQNSGKAFPRFKTVDEAVAAAKARSAAGGAGASKPKY